MTLQEYNELFKNPLKKKVYLTNYGGGIGGGDDADNSTLVSEEFTLESSLCSESTLRYGGCEATCLKVRVADISIAVNDWLMVDEAVVTDEYGYLLLQDGSYLLGADGGKIRLSGAGGTIPTETWLGTIGMFKVAEVIPTADRRFTDIVAYDLMYFILNMDVKDWYSAIYTPGQTTSVYTLRTTLFQWITSKLESDYLPTSFEEEDVDLVNDSLNVYQRFTVDGALSAKDVLTAICELNGVFGQTVTDPDTGDIIFKYVNLSDGESLTLDYYVDGSGTYEDYVTAQITGVIARGEEEDVGTQVGTLTNPYIIESNPLTYGIEGTQALQDALTNLLNVIKLQTFRPYQVTTYGNPFLPLGTRLTINTKNQTIVSYVINKRMTGIQALKDTLSAKGEMYQPNQVNSLASQVQRQKGKVHNLTVDVNQLNSEIYDPATGVKSQLQQVENEIVLKVDTNGNLALVSVSGDPDTGQTAFVVKAGNFAVDAQGNVTITGDITCKEKLSMTATDSNDNTYTTDVITQEFGSLTHGGPFTYEATYFKNADNSEYGFLTTNYSAGTQDIYAEVPIKLDSLPELHTGADDPYIESRAYGTRIDTNPSSFTSKASYRETDRGGNMIGFVGSAQHTNGTIDNRFAVCREINSNMEYNKLVLGLDASGNPSVTVDAPAEWRTAIGAAPASSKEYKENIKPITEDEARKILDVDIYSFDYKEEYGGEKNQYGVIAEELKEKIPYAVNIPKSVDGKVSVDYFKLIPHLIKTVQMQEERIAKLESLIEKMAIEQIIHNSITAKDSPS